jgi:8-oxo-dGTP pyrophosphatase MutT (NUDIX family)
VSDVLVPRPAATVILARDRAAGGFEVLMLLRNLKSDFVGGAYVFPGGAVDLEDATDEATAVCRGLDDVEASRFLGVERGGLAYWVACLRELFEEAGLLLASGVDGTALDMASASTTARFVAHRAAVNAGERRFLDVIADERLVLDLTSLAYFAHWVTPVGPPRRYDTRFFVAAAPADQVPVHDDKELVANVWVTPAEALERHERGEMQLILPTIKNLEAIARFTCAAELLDAAHGATTVPRIEPRIVRDGNGVRILLPGDPGFDDETSDDVADRSVGNDDITGASTGAPAT